MPKRRLTFSSAKRKRRKTPRRSRYKRRMARVRRPIRLFPKTAKVQLTYCTQVTLSSGASDVTHNFRLNSLHDPDATLAGHQPRGHDQWSQMYSKYCVIGATVFVEPLYASATGAYQLKAFLDDDTASDLYSITELRELALPKSRYRYVNVNQDSRGVQDKGNPNFSMRVGMKKFFGVGKNTQMFFPSGIGHGESTAVENEREYSAQIGANPLATCYLRLGAEKLPTSGVTPDAVVRVTINYLAVYFDPKEIGSS